MAPSYNFLSNIWSQSKVAVYDWTVMVNVVENADLLTLALEVV